MAKLAITALVAVKNEVANIDCCLESLTCLERVVVLDSHSNDGTTQVAEGRAIEVVQFQYAGGYPKKRQWALDQLSITTPWILLLDADESLTPQLIEEISEVVTGDPACNAYLIQKRFHFLGRKFRFGGFSHSAVLLFRRGKARFERLLEQDPSGLDMEVHERVIVDGTIGRLRSHLVHRDQKGLEAYIDRHNKYSTWEAEVRAEYLSKSADPKNQIAATPFGNLQERRRFLKMLAIRMPGEQYLWFLYHYILKLGFLEGRRGLIASQLRCQYIAQVRAKMYELKLPKSARVETSLDS